MEHLQGMPVLPRHPGGRQVNRLARDPRMRPTLHIKNSKDTKKELTESRKNRYNKFDLVEAPGTRWEPGVEGTPEKLISMSAEGARPYPG